MDRVEKACELNLSGYNCSQSLMMAYSELAGLSEKESQKLAAGLGRGLCIGDTCGAVSSAVVIIGALYAPEDKSDRDATRHMAGLTKEFCRRFRERRGTLNCRELLEKAKAEGKVAKNCVENVRECAEILEELIAENPVDR